MNSQARQYLAIPVFVVLTGVAGCSWLAGGTVVESATVVYTAGARKHTAAAQIPVSATTVFSTLIRLIHDRPTVVVENLNEDAFLIEVTSEGRSFTGQASSLDETHSLLYVWVDAGNSGQTGEQLVITVVELVCDELGVKYELVHY